MAWVTPACYRFGRSADSIGQISIEGSAQVSGAHFSVGGDRVGALQRKFGVASLAL